MANKPKNPLKNKNDNLICTPCKNSKKLIELFKILINFAVFERFFPELLAVVFYECSSISVQYYNTLMMNYRFIRGEYNKLISTLAGKQGAD